MTTITAAAVQADPGFLDLPHAVDRTLHFIREAASAGAGIVAFPETWLPGYPYWIWRGDVGYQRGFVLDYSRNSLVLGDENHRRIANAAALAGVAVVVGYSERAGGSLYIGQAIIDGAGETVLARRKLKPTHVERTLFGNGDGSGLYARDLGFARVGALSCWEHIQPLSKYAMYSEREDIHVAGWPHLGDLDGDGALSHGACIDVSRMYALEGRSFVLSATQLLGADTERVLRGDPAAETRTTGGATRIFDPFGASIGTTLAHDEEGLVLAELDLDLVALARHEIDVVGHYSRPDALRLILDREPQPPVVTSTALELSNV